MGLARTIRTPTALLALTIVRGEWTGLARAVLRAPAYAFLLDVALVALLMFVVWRAWSGRTAWRFHPLDGLAAAFFLLALIQILNPNVPSPLVGLEGFRKTAFTIVAYAIIRLSPEDESLPFFSIVAVGSVIAFLWSIRQSISPLPIELQIIDTAGTSPMSFQSGPVLRAFAPTAGPFHLGILGAAVAIIAVVLSRALSTWHLLVAMLAGIALGISLTRANMVGAVAALGVIVLVVTPMHERLRMGFRVAPVAAAIGLAVLVTARSFTPAVPPVEPSGGPAPSQAVSSGEPTLPNPLVDRSLRFRFGYWADHLQSISERPLIGYGTSSAGDGFDRLYRDTGSENFNPHSLYLKAALELGLIGFLLLIAILGLALLACRRAYTNDRSVALIGLGILILTMVSGVSGPMLDAYPFNLLFWAMIGWVVNAELPRSGQSARSADPATA